MDEKDITSIKNEDFIVRVRPFLDDDGLWNGEIDISIITQPDNELQDDDYFQMMHFCKMLASTVPIMEVNEDLRELVHNYVTEIIDKHEEVVVENNRRIISKEDNVIKLDFASRTKGNA